MWLNLGWDVPGALALARHCLRSVRLEADWVEQCLIVDRNTVAPSFHVLEFPERERALGFLRPLVTRPDVVSVLREALAPGSPTLTFSRLSNDEVIDQLAWRLASGALRIAVKLGRRPTGGGTQSDTPGALASSPIAPAPLPPASPLASTGGTPTAVVPPSIPATDSAAQAAKLRESAQLGVPFCEVCR
jgi:hypothetical protein